MARLGGDEFAVVIEGVASLEEAEAAALRLSRALWDPFPIGEELLLKGLYQVVPGEFYCAATRPPSVYRGNPFQIEVALASLKAAMDAEQSTTAA